MLFEGVESDNQDGDELEEQKQKNETEIQQQKKEFEEKKVREKRLRIVSAIFQLVVSKLNRFKYKFIKSRTF